MTPVLPIRNPPDRGPSPQPGTIRVRLLQPAEVSRAASLLADGLVALWAAVLLFRYLDWQFDDGMIVSRTVQNIIAGIGWTMNGGEMRNPVTSVLHTLLVAAGAVGTGDILLAAHGVGALSLGAIGGVFRRYFQSSFGLWPSLAGAVALMAFLAANATWGIESHIFLALCLWFVLREQKRRDGWFLLALATLARPDALALTAIKGLADLWRTRRIPWRGISVFLLVLSPWILFSLWLFGQFFPATLSQKIWQGHSGYWGYGPIYLKAFIRHFLAGGPVSFTLWGLGILGNGWLLIRRDPLGLLTLFAVLQQVCYSLLNVPGYHWYFSFIDAMLIIGAFVVLGETARRLSVRGTESTSPSSPSFGVRWPFWTLTGLLFAYTAWMHPSPTAPILDLRNEAYREAALQLRTELPAGGPVALLEVGTVGFYDRRPVVDLTGLTTANPEFMTGKHSDRFFQNPPPLVLLHDPPWHQERALFDDIRFAILYELRKKYPASPSDYALRLYGLKEDRLTFLRRQGVEGYLREGFIEKHYPPFTLHASLSNRPVPPVEDLHCFIDTLNGRLIRDHVSWSFARWLFSVKGWVFSDKATSHPDNITILLRSASGSAYALPAERYDRPDVAHHFKLPYQNVGFEIHGAINHLPAGRYRLEILVRQGESLQAWIFPPPIELR